MKVYIKSIYKILFFCFFLLNGNLALSQFYFSINNYIPVISNNILLPHAWEGGINNAQFSTIDFDFDNDEDLFIFDRSSNNIRLYENDNNSYKFIFNGASFFPNELIYKVTFVDYNKDGKKDLFTYGIGGVKVYKNTGNTTIGLQWELASNLLYSHYGNNYTNLYVSSVDIPAIVDVDFDGDIDILTYDINGQHVEYHQNQSIDLYGIPDSLIFELRNECWGKFTENLTSSTITLNDNTYPCNTGGVSNPEILINNGEQNSEPSRHSGSTILAMDIDNSGVYDLIIGDVSVSYLNLLINGGSMPNTNSAMISKDTLFPNNTNKVNVQVFPASFWEDIDFDTKKDLIICPNARNISENKKSVWTYKNVGTNLLPTFEFQTQAFLQGDMIDVGSGSIPSFFDYNLDGLEDLFISNFYEYDSIVTRRSSISCFKNTGTINSPEFTLITSDFLNLSSNPNNLRNVPTYGDLDHDGDKDIIMGMSDGSLSYFENLNSNSLIFANPVNSLTDNTGSIISTSSFAFPQLFDIDKDGLIDLLLGNMNGEIAFYKNIGTLSSPSFQLINSTLGNITSSNPAAFPSPHFFTQNNSTYLFLGNADGSFEIYDQIDNHLNSGNSFHLQSTNINHIQTEAYSSFWVNDIDHDNQIDLFIGQDLGGLYHFEYDASASIQTNENEMKFNIFPNPTTANTTIDNTNELISFIQIIDINGKLFKSISANEKLISINTNDLTSGIYFIQINTKQNQNFTYKLIVSH